MTREDIIRMAREAGYTSYDSLSERLHEFAALVAAEERKTCAGIADKYAKANEESDNMADAFVHCAAAIRARGNA